MIIQLSDSVELFSQVTTICVSKKYILYLGPTCFLNILDLFFQINKIDELAIGKLQDTLIAIINAQRQNFSLYGFKHCIIQKYP